MATRFHQLTISDVRRQGDDAVSLAFTVPENLKEAFVFTPGQYLTLRATINGKDERRSYSICSPLSGACLEVGIKRLEGGAFSQFANELKPGDALQVMEPEGRFIVSVNPDAKRDILLIAAGSGITPVLSIARSVLESEPDSTVTLVYGNRTTASIMFREDLEELKDRYLDRFSLLHVLSREDQDVDVINGRIDEAKIATLVDKGMIDPAVHNGIYLCGPQEMIESCSAKLITLGADQSDIHFELFTPADGSAPVARAAENRAKAAGDVEVETILDGTRRKFQMDGKTATVLAAAHEAGIELPFSCAGGMCCTCRCQVREGEAAMDVNYSLEPWEIEAGFVLACQARPKSGKLVLDFDAT
jgi:ring-1,2-phenylacetyl-CoA epoxidase subunit PaaE